MKARFIIPAALALAVAALLSCGPRKVAKPVAPMKKAKSSWTYVSDTSPIVDIRVSGGTAYALSGGKIITASLDGSGQIEAVDSGLPKEDWSLMNGLVVGPKGDIWIGGGNRLYAIAEGTIRAIDEIQLNFKSIELLAMTDKGQINVAGDNFLAVGEGGAWRLWQLPFCITGGTSTGDRVYLMAADKGIATIVGDVVTEYPHPLFDIAPFSKQSYFPLSVAASRDGVWVLWTGSSSYLSVLRPSGEWDAYTFSVASTGLPQKLFEAGGDILLLTEAGLFVIAGGSGSGVPLVPLVDSRRAVGLTYTIAGQDIIASSTGKFAGLKPFDKKAASRPTLGPPPEPVEIDKTRLQVLVPLKADIRSPVTQVRGTGDRIVVGTESMGMTVLSKDGAVENDIFLFDAKPVMPLSSVLVDDKTVYFALASGEMGLFDGTVIRKYRAATRPKEKFLGVAMGKDAPYAISLVPAEEIITIYTIQDKGLLLLYERPVDLATGIGSIGGFAVAPDGTIWFTVKSYGEGQEMGAAELRPSLPELVYNGAVPMPPEYALIIPNGLSSIQIADDGTTYLGGMDGLVKINPDRSIIKFKEPEGLVGDFVTDMAVDRSGRAWLLTVEGLGYLDGDKLTFPFGPPYRDAAVSCLGLSNNGSAIMIDENGLKKYDGKQWKMLAERAGIAGSPIRDCQGDGLGNIWVVTDRAVSIFKEM
jgi:hypothetical protein